MIYIGGAYNIFLPVRTVEGRVIMYFSPTFFHPKLQIFYSKYMNKKMFCFFFQILEAAAETEEAWHGCGQRPGLEIWRIVVSVRACLVACRE